MIKVIKHGIKKFIGKCSQCGCEFEYENIDIIGLGVHCPECGAYYSHPSQVEPTKTYGLLMDYYNNGCNHEWEPSAGTSAGCLTYCCRRCGRIKYEYNSYLNNFGDIK